MECVIITGLSGAGRSTALKAFEDMNYFCVDNLPPVMATALVNTCREENTVERIAMVMDTRSGVFFEKIYDAVAQLREDDVQCSILFLDTADDVLIRRYKEVRRPHPMHQTSIAEGIAEERRRLKRIREMADHILDSTNLTGHQLVSTVTELYSEQSGKYPVPMFVSFGYKYGIPMDADLVLDVRFLPNPYYVEELRPKTGLCSEIQEYVFSTQEALEFLKKTQEYLLYLLPRYATEGRRQVVIAIGCTGGKHRSVASAQRLYEWSLAQGYRSVVIHRELS